MSARSKTGRASKDSPSRKKTGHPAVLELSIISTLVLLLKWDVLSLAYINDVALHVVNVAEWVMHNNFWPYPPEMPGFIGHPPFFYEVLAFSYMVFGFRPFSAHLATVFFSSICLFFTYRLGRRFDSHVVGVSAALMLLSHPLYFAQSGMANLDMAVASMMVASLYFALEGRWRLYLVSASCMIMTKESALVFFPILLAYHLLYVSRERRDLLLILMPALLFPLWVLGNKLVYGWFFLPYHVGVVSANIGSFFSILSSPSTISLEARDMPLLLKNFFELASQLFMSRLLVVIVLVSSYPLLSQARRFIRSGGRDMAKVLGGEYFLMVSYSLAFMFLYVLTAGTHLMIRYILPALPFYFLFLSVGLRRAVKDYRLVLAVTLIVCYLFYTSWYVIDAVSPLDFESNMYYTHQVRNEMNALRYVESDHPGSLIVNYRFGFFKKIQDPSIGYVTRPLDFVLPHKMPELDFSGSEVLYITHSLKKHDGRRNTIVILKVVYETEVLREFRSGGLYTYVVKINSMRKRVG
ncbi:MAG: glycosyltransferase family 39 protein [Candidatus Altiarchaeota archaeon]